MLALALAYLSLVAYRPIPCQRHIGIGNTSMIGIYVARFSLQVILRSCR